MWVILIKKTSKKLEVLYNNNVLTFFLIRNYNSKVMNVYL
jgi:hypothetical protein